MLLRIFVEPQQGASYDDQLAVARRAEECGFDAFFRSDHYLVQGDRDGLPGPTDSWITLAGLARETSRIRLGTLVSSATFRNPAVLALTVAQVDRMSGGRVELGLGAGWNEAEHRSHALAFPDTPTRFDLLEEQLELVTRLWGTPAGERVDFSGQHYTVVDSPGLPKPVQSSPPVIIGGTGRRRTPALAARYAAEFNSAFAVPDETVVRFDRVRAACTAIGRHPDTLALSVAHATVVARTAAGLRSGLEVYGGDADEVAAHALVGSPGEVVDRIGRYADAGADRTYLQLPDLTDLDHLELIAAEVLPQLPCG
jgi:F420-dependent oxidoreductase-like protein